MKTEPIEETTRTAMTLCHSVGAVNHAASKTQIPITGPRSAYVGHKLGRQLTKRSATIALSVSLAVALATGSAVGAVRPAPPPDPAIAFVAVHSSADNNDLIVMNADGSNQTVILSSSTDKFYFPAWSPDLDPAAAGFQGSVLFEVLEPVSGLVSIYVIDVVVSPSGVQGEDLRLLLANAFLPTWAPAPNGHHIAYCGNHEQPEGIFLLNVNTGVSTLVVPDPAPFDTAVNVGWPAWNPDGTKIAYRRFTSGTAAITGIKQVVDEATGEPMDGPETVLNIGDPVDWSRSGRFLAYAAGGDVPNYGRGPIYIVDLSTDPPTQTPLANTPWAQNPTWPPSTTDSEIVFMSRRGDAGSGKRRIVKRDLITDVEVVLAERKGYHLYSPDWRRY